MPKRILVTGSIAYDVLLGYDGEFSDAIDPSALDSLSLSFFSPHYVRHHGGTGANIAWGLKLLGQDPVLVGTVGKDGKEYLDKMSEFGISVDNIQTIEDQVTATAIINTDICEHQISFFHPGADSYGEWPSDLSSDDVAYGIVSARDTTAMVDGMEWCEENQVPVIFDPGQQVISFGDDAIERMIKMSSGIVINEYEWEITQKKLGREEEGVLELLGWEGKEGQEGFVIVTLGDKGCRAISKDGSFDVPAYKTNNVVNPTGAGDAFRAGFITGLVEGKDIKEACELGAAMGVCAVEREGTLLENVTRSDIELIIEN
ncbi:carbohydrate kinase family protein [Patescibacteria group bacterium]|nr:carbohydrate kinase family protein [Patescibacteria group bacterium]MBU1123660.1 carbohydrate kinase family protein [Patescibacteria group bacterium]